MLTKLYLALILIIIVYIKNLGLHKYANKPYI